MLGGAVAGSDPLLFDTARFFGPLSGFLVLLRVVNRKVAVLVLAPGAAGAVVVAANLGRPLEPHDHLLSPSGELWDQDAVSDG